MGIGNPNPRSLANLRPPFAVGNQLRRGKPSPWLSRANEIREDLWRAAPSETRAAMAKQLVELSLGIAQEPVFDGDGAPVYHPDGSQKMQPLPPARRAEMQRWAMDTWLKCVGGSFSMKSIEATVQVETVDRAEEIRAAAEFMRAVGMEDKLPEDMRQLIASETQVDP